MPRIKPRTKRNMPRTVWSIGRILTVLLIIVAIITIWQFGYPEYQKFQYGRSIAFTDPENNFDVLILPFSRHRGHKEWLIEENIVRRFSEMDIEHLYVRYDSTVTTSGFDFARKIGKKREADMVIWGDLEAIPQDSSIANVRYVLINPSDARIKSEDESGDRKFQYISDIRKEHVFADVDYVVRYVVGFFMYQRKRYKEALDQFSLLTSEYPDTSVVVHFYIGNCFMVLDSLENAKKELSLALEINPQFAEIYNNLAILLSDLGETNEARKYYELALGISPEDAYVHNNFASLLKDSGETEEAGKHYSRAIEINPEYANAHYNFANLLSDLGETDEAKIHYRRAIGINPEDADAHCEFANLLSDLGETDEAKKQYRRAIGINPEDTYVHNNFASLLK
ncbi:MAG: tetratricopeptide repeat protein, partial [Calditrichaeota bacterium]|nr:tetratricopeptide repeat protein [Calditrichota bacterium]